MPAPDLPLLEATEVAAVADHACNAVEVRVIDPAGKGFRFMLAGGEVIAVVVQLLTGPGRAARVSRRSRAQPTQHTGSAPRPPELADEATAFQR